MTNTQAKPPSEKLYRIKPLVWDDFCCAYSPFGRYKFWCSREKYLWQCSGDSSSGTFHDSAEQAKLAAESHYRERLMQCLEETTQQTEMKDE